jgi:hypothetical protein
MLKSVRWIGLRTFARNVHWLQALAIVTSTAAAGPRMSIVASAMANDNDMLDPPRVVGSEIFTVEEKTASASSSRKSPGRSTRSV